MVSDGWLLELETECVDEDIISQGDVDKKNIQKREFENSDNLNERKQISVHIS